MRRKGWSLERLRQVDSRRWAELEAWLDTHDPDQVDPELGIPDPIWLPGGAGRMGGSGMGAATNNPRRRMGRSGMR
jgi:hypothetical protein